MSKIAVVYWSGTGNTEIMAQEVAAGAKAAGAEADVLTPSDFDSSKISAYDAIAFGCPAMGAEVLEEAEFEPMWNECEGSLSGVKIALFGSYGWGDGQWMRDWVERMEAAGARIVGGEGLMSHETPDDSVLAECENLGKQLAGM